jgi:hypothetical protein
LHQAAKAQIQKRLLAGTAGKTAAIHALAYAMLITVL